MQDAQGRTRVVLVKLRQRRGRLPRGSLERDASGGGGSAAQQLVPSVGHGGWKAKTLKGLNGASEIAERA